MRNLAKLCAVAVICLGATGGAGAQSRPKPKPPKMSPSQAYASLTLPRTPLYFGVVHRPGPSKLEAKVTAHVVANRPYRLGALFRGLTLGPGQAAIPAKQMTVTINGKVVPIGTDCVEIASGGPTPVKGVDVPIVIEVEVKGSTFYPAGRYGGNLELFIK